MTTPKRDRPAPREIDLNTYNQVQAARGDDGPRINPLGWSRWMRFGWRWIGKPPFIAPKRWALHNSIGWAWDRFWWLFAFLGACGACWLAWRFRP